MQYFLALDAGGTKTVGVLADEERELARAATGTIKLLRTGPEQARQNLESLLGQLATTAGVDLQMITRTCIGTSGASVPLVAEWLRKALASKVGGELLLCGDEEIALDAAFHGGPGILVIAGTGSNVIGRTAAGKYAHAGGWGPALADVGSGHWIGQEALRSAFHALDARQPTQLIESVQRHWQLATLEELVEKANTNPAPDFASLTPVVVASAQSGDTVAQSVLRRAGEELAQSVLLVVKHMQQSDETATEKLPDVAYTGSVLQRIGLVRQSMVVALQRVHPLIRVGDVAVDAVSGALWRARRGWLHDGASSGI